MRHRTSKFDICEVDLDMQMSFLNAAPCGTTGGLHGDFKLIPEFK